MKNVWKVVLSPSPESTSLIRHFRNKKETFAMISRTVAKGQPIAVWRVTSNNPTNNCGTYFGSSPLLVSKEAKLSFLSNIKYFIFKPSTAILTATSVNLFSDEMTSLTGSEKEA